MARAHLCVKWKTLPAKENFLADLKEFAAAKLGQLAGQLEAQKPQFAFAGAYNA